MIGTAATEWLTAVGTCGAVVVAVGAPALKRFLDHRHRPSLEISFSKDDEVPMVIASDLSGVFAYEVTFRVTTRGDEAALGVRAQLRNYVVRTFPPMSGYEYARPALRPQPLGWASRPTALEPSLREQVVIPGGGAFDVAVVARYTPNDRELRVIPVAGAPFKPRGPSMATAIEHWLFVTVTADNAAPVTASLWLDTPKCR